MMNFTEPIEIGKNIVVAKRISGSGMTSISSKNTWKKEPKSYLTAPR